MLEVIIGEQRTFKTKVKFMMPTEDGTHQQVSFTARYVMLSSDDSKAAAELTALEFARRVLIGWGSDLIDDGKNPVPFSEEAKEAILQIPIIAINVTRAYNDAINKGLPSIKN